MTLPLLLLLLAEPPAAAPSADALWGRPVTAVRIEAAPEEVARLERYVEVAPGQPLQAEDVRHLVELMHATGEYEDVQVDAQASGAGVEVVLRPVLAPALDEVRLEGDRVLSADELRAAARLRPREVIWPARLQEAAAAAQAALVQRGYLDAAVQVRREGAGRATAAVFSVQAGPRVRVRRLRVEGVAPRLQALLEPQARPRAGAVFTRAEAAQGAERIRRALVRQGRWGARVEVRESREAAAAALDLTFEVAAAGRAQVEFTGDPLDPELRQAVVRLLREGALQADALEEGTERIEEAFLSRGHRQVAVTRTQDRRAEAEVVTYAVAPGPAAVVGSLRVAAEEATGLEAQVATQPGAPLVERALAEDVRRLQRALEEQGYAQAEVQLEAPEGGGALPVVFRVREGPRVEVAAVRVDAPPAEGQATPAVELRLRVGQPYRVRDLARDHASVLAAYRDSGYPQAEVAPEVAFEEQGRRAHVVLRVRPGPRIVVDHVVISGVRRTRESVVRRELLLEEGDPLGLQKVLESQRRLAALGIFERVSITEMDPETPHRRSLLVAAREAPLTTVAYGVGYAERDRLRGSVEVTRRNLFGMDRTLSTFARVSFRGSRLLTTFREPYLLGRRQELFLTGFREEEDRDFFDFVRWGGIVQSARALGPGWSVIARYTYQQTHSFNIVNPDEVGREFTNSTLSGPSGTLVLDTRDDPLDPRAGRFVSADLQLSHEWLGGDSFLKGFVQAAVYERVSARAVVALSGRVGLARTFGLGDSLLLPRPDRFYAGGDYSLRGFRIDAVDPLGGNALLLGGAELRIDTGRFLGLALFTDAGNVFPLVSRVDVGRLRYTAGVGLRYKSAFGPLRVDWGYKLDRRDDESASRLHVTIGHAF
jgi:outer membrane protein insertion porin family